MKKIKITEELEKEIVNKYITNEISNIESLALHFHVGKKKINEILFKNRIIKNSKGGQKKYDGIDLNKKYKEAMALKPKEGNIIIAKCKKTNKEFNDYLNKSGSLSDYIKIHYPEVEIPNNYAKKIYYIKNQKLWHEQYFDLIEKPKNDIRKCKYCDWETSDVYNKTGCYENHLKELHNKSIDDLINDYPEEIKYHNTQQLKNNRKEILNNENKFVICKICNEKFKGISYSHLLNKHNMNFTDYFKLYPNSKIFSTDTQKMLSIKLKQENINMKPVWESKPEKEIFDYINSLGIICEKKNRKLLQGQEIDIIIPNKKIGIEFNGVIWHSEKYGNKNMNYHLNKTIILKKEGWKLIHIFEDEWYLKNEIVKEKIKHILGCSNGIRIGGRQCEIKEISVLEKNSFLNKFHIQGEDKSTIKLGAFYNNILVSVMCFNNKRNMTIKINGWELTRFATNSAYIISGIASKMLKYFIKKYNPTEVLSFADKRWTINEDNLYTKLGFIQNGDTKPNYSYHNKKIDRYKRFHKFNFGISSLKKKGMWEAAVNDLISKGGTEKDMTEWKCMQFHGWDRIWDCGLIRYKLVISSQN